MTFIAGILTFVLVVNALLLILLILVQLPKKDAGAGLAFGSGAADALFGAGSGNVLTKVTKWATVIFIGLAVVLGVVQDKLSAHSSTSNFLQQVQQKQMQTPAMAPAPLTTPASQPPVNASNAMPILLPATAPTTTPTTAPAPSTPAK